MDGQSLLQCCVSATKKKKKKKNKEKKKEKKEKKRGERIVTCLSFVDVLRFASPSVGVVVVVVVVVVVILLISLSSSFSLPSARGRGRLKIPKEVSCVGQTGVPRYILGIHWKAKCLLTFIVFVPHSNYED